MTVRAVLEKKGTKVLTTGAGVTVAEAARLLTENNIGAVVVCDSGRSVIGILSERDIVRGLSRFGAEALGYTVDKLMTDQVRTCSPDDSVKHVMAAMTSGRFRHFPVVDDGALAGILSIGDVVKYRLEQTQLEIDVMRDVARAR